MRFLVTGATGRCGTPLTRLLLARGHAVRALTRDPGSERARALAAAGAELRKGDLLSPASLEPSLFEGLDGAYLITTPAYGFDEDAAMGRNLVEAAKAAGLRHLVFQSVLYAESSIPHCASKGEVEAHLGGSGVPHTVLRPALFLEILLPHLASPDDPAPREFRTDVPQSWVAVDDIALAGAAALERSRPEGARYDLASVQAASMDELGAQIAELTGRPCRFVHAPWRLGEAARSWLGEPRASAYLSARGFRDLDADYYGPLNEGPYPCDPSPLKDAFGLTPRTPASFLRERAGPAQA